MDLLPDAKDYFGAFHFSIATLSLASSFLRGQFDFGYGFERRFQFPGESTFFLAAKLEHAIHFLFIYFAAYSGFFFPAGEMNKIIRVQNQKMC